MVKLNFNPVAHDPVFRGPAFGWRNDPGEVARTMDLIEAETGVTPQVNRVAAELLSAADDNAPVFFWEAEEKVLGRRLGTWNQLRVGACVGFGNGRAGQDTMFYEIAAGESEEFPGSEVCPEVIYGGSRVEVGGGQISGDGSVGAWAAKWLAKWGIVVRGVYGNLDLTKYDEATCKILGDRGIPADVENLAKLHPVTAVAQVNNGNEVWAMLGAGKPIAVCSQRGFAMVRNPDGSCDPQGSWAHCMAKRGRFIDPKGRKRIVIGNSWGDYLGSTNNVFEYVNAAGQIARMELPPGHFHTSLDVAHEMTQMRDTFALAGLTGWARVRMNYNPLA